MKQNKKEMIYTKSKWYIIQAHFKHYLIIQFPIIYDPFNDSFILFNFLFFSFSCVQTVEDNKHTMNIRHVNVITMKLNIKKRKLGKKETQNKNKNRKKRMNSFRIWLIWKPVLCIGREKKKMFRKNGVKSKQNFIISMWISLDRVVVQEKSNVVTIFSLLFISIVHTKPKKEAFTKVKILFKKEMEKRKKSNRNVE